MYRAEAAKNGNVGAGELALAEKLLGVVDAQAGEMLHSAVSVGLDKKLFKCRWTYRAVLCDIGEGYLLADIFFHIFENFIHKTCSLWHGRQLGKNTA